MGRGATIWRGFGASTVTDGSALLSAGVCAVALCGLVTIAPAAAVIAVATLHTRLASPLWRARLVTNIERSDCGSLVPFIRYEPPWRGVLFDAPCYDRAADDLSHQGSPAAYAEEQLDEN